MYCFNPEFLEISESLGFLVKYGSLARVSNLGSRDKKVDKNV